MSYKSKSKDHMYWIGTWEADNFVGDGSKLTNLPAGTEVDPIWEAQSGAFLKDGSLYSVSGALLDGSLYSVSGALLDGALYSVSGALLDGSVYSVSGAILDGSPYAASGAATVTLGAHVSDSSDPHGSLLTQNSITAAGTISGASIKNTADHTTSAAAYCAGIITHTAATPPTASNFPRGTIYVQYTA